MKQWCRAASIVFCMSVLGASGATMSSLAIEADMRSDKLPGAQVVRRLPAGAPVQLLGLEGGWAWVSASDQTGWVRAHALRIDAGVSAAASVEAGRHRANIATSALAVRSMPVNPGRHALIVAIGRFADPAEPPLRGTGADVESAIQIARAMQVPDESIVVLQDEQATAAGIRGALRSLAQRAQEGDRVFIALSAPATRRLDDATGECAPAVIVHEGLRGGAILRRDLDEWIADVARRAGMTLVLHDVGDVDPHDAQAWTRGVLLPGDDGPLRPKFVRKPDCSSRDAAPAREAFPRLVELSSSRPGQASFSDEAKGGLATQFVRDCIVRDAPAGRAGAIEIDQIRACAQHKIDARLQPAGGSMAQQLTLRGQFAFVPLRAGAGLAPVQKAP